MLIGLLLGASPSFGAETTTQATAEQTQVAAAIESLAQAAVVVEPTYDGIEVEKRQKPHRVLVPFGAASKKMFR